MRNIIKIYLIPLIISELTINNNDNKMDYRSGQYK